MEYHSNPNLTTSVIKTENDGTTVIGCVLHRYISFTPRACYRLLQAQQSRIRLHISSMVRSAWDIQGGSSVPAMGIDIVEFFFTISHSLFSCKTSYPVWTTAVVEADFRSIPVS